MLHNCDDYVFGQTVVGNVAYVKKNYDGCSAHKLGGWKIGSLSWPYYWKKEKIKERNFIHDGARRQVWRDQ